MYIKLAFLLHIHTLGNQLKSNKHLAEDKGLSLVWNLNDLYLPLYLEGLCCVAKYHHLDFLPFPSLVVKHEQNKTKHLNNYKSAAERQQCCWHPATGRWERHYAGGQGGDLPRTQTARAHSGLWSGQARRLRVPATAKSDFQGGWPTQGGKDWLI